MNFGSVVVVDLRASHGGDLLECTIIGVPHYSDGRIVVVADEQAHGMPVNVCHLQETGLVDPSAQQYRTRFDNLYPGFLKELT